MSAQTSLKQTSSRRSSPIRWQKPCSGMGMFPLLRGFKILPKLIKFSRFVTCGPAIQAFPSFLEESRYQDITNNRKTAFQKGFNTELTAFEWMARNPKQLAALQTVMTALQSDRWLAGFDLLDQAARAFPAGQPGKVFLVDVGGGHGHQAVQLRERYPDLSGHLVLQDLSQIVDRLPPIDGIKVVAQDFFEKQGIAGKYAHLWSSEDDDTKNSPKLIFHRCQFLLPPKSPS